MPRGTGYEKRHRVCPGLSRIVCHKIIDLYLANFKGRKLRRFYKVRYCVPVQTKGLVLILITYLSIGKKLPFFNCFENHRFYAAVALLSFSCKKSSAPASKDIWTSYPTNGAFISSIAIDSQGNKWFASTGSGLLKFEGANWTTYNTSNSGLADNYPLVIAIDAGGNKWIGSGGSGISKFDGTNWSIYDTTNSGLLYNTVDGN